METIRTCPECHQPLSADAPDGLCPQCLMKAASGPPPSAEGEGLAGDIIDIGDPAEVAKKLPQFEILEMLGRGGMGVVYKARQLQLDRIVALKILPPVDALSPDFVARFTREARALAKLNHSNIVAVHDFGETGGLYYIVMEFVDGANLRQLQEARKLTPAEALAIVPKICDALQYAHEEGLVHRDIKPENLLIDKKGRVKIADFGLAKMLRREPLDMTLTLSGMALGTMRYMAPEQMDKPETVDHRADIYSLGVVIYEMLTGELPTGHFELPSQKAQVDARLDGIVLHALEHDVERRYQHASEVRDDVERVASNPQVARPPSPTPAAGAAGDDTPAQPWKSPPFQWWRAFGWLMLGWLVVGALWNFRTPGCLLASLVMGALVTEIMIRHARRNPRWAEAWRKAGAPKKIAFFGADIAFGALAFMLLINAMSMKWDYSTFRWNYLAQSRAEFEGDHKGKEYELIRQLDAFKDQVPTTELSYRFYSWSGDTKLWGDSGPYKETFGWVSMVESLLIGAGILLMVFQQCFAAESFSLWRFQRGGWRSALAFASAVLASVVCVYGALNITWLSFSHGGSTKSMSVHATMEQVDAALNHWAAAGGYTPGDRNEWNLLTVPKGEIVAQVGVFNAWKPSPFDRWRMTWSGLRRASPHVAVHIISSEKPAQSVIDLWWTQPQTDSTQSEPGIITSLLEAVSKSPDIDPSKPANVQSNGKPGDASASDAPSPRLLLCGFLGLTLLWTTIRVWLADWQSEGGMGKPVEIVTGKPQSAPDASRATPTPWGFLTGKEARPRRMRLATAAMVILVIIMATVIIAARELSLSASMVLAMVLGGAGASVSLLVLGGAGISIFDEWRNSQSPFAWKVIRTVLWLVFALCFVGFFGPQATTSGHGTSLTIGAPFPWFDLEEHSSLRIIFSSWAWAILAAGCLCLYALGESQNVRPVGGALITGCLLASCVIGIAGCLWPYSVVEDHFFGLGQVEVREVSRQPGVTTLGIVGFDEYLPAAKAGVVLGDTILSMGGRQVHVSGLDGIDRIWKETPVGSEVEITLLRNNKTMVLHTTRPPDPVAVCFYAYWQFLAGFCFLLFGVYVLLAQPFGRANRWRGVIATFLGLFWLVGLLTLSGNFPDGPAKELWNVLHHGYNYSPPSYGQKFAACIAAFALLLLGVFDIRRVFGQPAQPATPASSAPTRESL